MKFFARNSEHMVIQRNCTFCFFKHAFLHGSSLGIYSFKFFEMSELFLSRMEEWIETIIGWCNYTTSINSGANYISDMKGIDIFLNIEKFKESSQSRRDFLWVTIHHFESFFYHNSIFIYERNDISNSSNSNNRQKIIKNLIFLFERKFWFCKESIDKFECYSDTSNSFKWIIRRNLRIYNR